MKRFFAFKLIGLVLLVTPAAQSGLREVVDTQGLLKTLSSVESMADYRDYTSHLISSYDRTGGNEDWGGKEPITDGQVVLADLQGPGAISRFWSANPEVAGRIRIYLDHQTRPVVDLPLTDFFAGKTAPFLAPLTMRSSGGYVSFFPIVFSERCRIVVEKSDKFYYQIGYIKFNSNREAKTFALPLSTAEDKALQATLKRWSESRTPTLSQVDHSNTLLKHASIDPGQTNEVMRLTGSGRIDSFSMRLKTKDLSIDEKRRLILRGYFDHHNEPDIEAPLSDFFGDSFEGNGTSSLFLSQKGETQTLLLPMPFGREARFTIENANSKNVEVEVGTTVSTVQFDPARTGYLHARFSQERTVNGKVHHWLNLKGQRGHFVGVVQVMAGKNFWILEGDDQFRVDTETWMPSSKSETTIAPWNGTGAEDYFNSGWYFADGPVQLPLQGVVTRDDRGHVGAYRWHVLDTPTFLDSIDAQLEHGGTNDVAGSYFSSLVFWYASGESPSSRVRLTAKSLESPSKYEVPPANDLVLSARGAGLQAVDWNSPNTMMTAGRLLLLGAQSKSVRYAFELKGDDRYRIRIYSGTRAGLGDLKIKIDEKVLNPRIKLGANHNWYEPLIIDQGVYRLSAGKHVLEIEAADTGQPTAFAGIGFTPLSPLLRDWKLSETYPNPGNNEGFDTVYAPEPGSSLQDEVKWSQAKVTTDGWVNLTTQLEKTSHAVVYASTEVTASQDFATRLLVGSDDGVKIWLNGKLIHRDETLHGMTIDETAIPIQLTKGKNRLVLKVAQGVGGWSYSARIVDPMAFVRH